MMNIAEKTLLLKQDFDDVKQAGRFNPIISSENLNGNVSGVAIAVNDVVDMSHNVGVKLSSKNLFNSSQLLAATGWTETDGVYSGIPGELYQIYHPTTGNISLFNGFKSNTQYTISFKGYSDDENTVGAKLLTFRFIYSDDTSTDIWIRNNVEKTYTLTSTAGKTIVGLHTSYGKNSMCYVWDIQLELGTTATPYTPYIEDFAKANLSKNLFDGKINQKLNLNGSGVNRTVGESANYNCAIIKVKPNTTYCISGDFDSTSSRPTQDKNVRIATFTNYPQVGEVSNQFASGSNVFTIKTSETSNYLFLWFMLPPTGYQVGEFQVEEGDTATKYIPYQELVPVEVSKYGKNLFDKSVAAASIDNWINQGSGYKLIKIFVGKGSTVTASYKQDLVIDMDCPYAGIIFDIVNKPTGTFIYHKTIAALIKKTVTGIAADDYIYVRANIYNEETLSKYMQYIGNDLQIEINPIATTYEPYIEPTIYQTNADGNVEGVTSIAPNMTLLSNNNSVVINAHYYKDPDIVISNLQQSVALSGGE